MLEDFLEARASFRTKITLEVDESPFLNGELTIKTTNKYNIFLRQKGKKILVQIFSALTYFKEVTYTVGGTLLIDTNIRVLLYV